MLGYSGRVTGHLIKWGFTRVVQRVRPAQQQERRLQQQEQLLQRQLLEQLPQRERRPYRLSLIHI